MSGRTVIFILIFCTVSRCAGSSSSSSRDNASTTAEYDAYSPTKSLKELIPRIGPPVVPKPEDVDNATVHPLQQQQQQQQQEQQEQPACRMGYGIMDYYPTQDRYYQHQTCYWCYHFVPAHRRKHHLSVVRDRIILHDGKQRLDFKFAVENATYYWDPEDQEAWAVVTDSLVDGLEAAKLRDCCTAALSCCLHALTLPRSAAGSRCPGTWDGWSCFPPTPASTTVSVTCPPYAYKGKPECALEARKECLGDGTWARNSRDIEETNYASCSQRHYHLFIYYWEAAMHTFSLLALCPAIFIIIYYRQLRVQRFYLHLNFFCALLGKAFFNLLDVLVLRVPEYTGTNTLLDDNTAGCRLLVFLTKMCSLAVWTWMLAESVYLHRLIVAAFRGGGKTYVYVLIGWVPAVVLGISWAVSRAIVEDYQCWLGDDHSHGADLYLITELPKMIILIVDATLLANMLRVLLTKLRNVNNDTSTATRRAVKATSFLLPMFGLQFFSTIAIPPDTVSCSAMQMYSLVASSLDGLQGLYVALVYCFLNKEVKLQVRRSVYRLRGHIAPDRSYGTSYDPRTDVSLLNSVTERSYDPRTDVSLLNSVTERSYNPRTDVSLLNSVTERSYVASYDPRKEDSLNHSSAAATTTIINLSTPAVATSVHEILTSVDETPTSVDETPTSVDETPTSVDETPTSVDETPTSVDETPTSVDETPTYVDETPTSVDETPTSVDETPTSVDETPTSVDETLTYVDETPTSVDETPTSVDETPTSVDETLTYVDETPTSVDETPTSVDETPSSVDETPSSVDETPSSVDETPSSVDETPTSVDETPSSVDETLTCVFRTNANSTNNN
ncbi:uncharacterized protein [Procambarus clarkii]|uniref:uncharacterized protein n=1 Tax=Procambarus clarkii TaxID=6728 RepID=UPI0037445004